LVDSTESGQDLNEETVNCNVDDDLSALAAAAAEFVPTLQETLPDNLNSIDEQSDINIRTEELADFNVDDNVVDATDSGQDLNEDTLDCGIDDEGLSELNSVATPGEYFVTTSFEEMMQIIQDYFERTDTRFVVQKRTKDFGMTGMFYLSSQFGLVFFVYYFNEIGN